MAALAAHLASLSANTAEKPHTVVLAASVIIDTADNDPYGVWASINRMVAEAGKYVKLDLSACTAVDNMIQGIYSENAFSIIKDNEYIKGIMLPDTLTSIGDWAFMYCSGLTSVTIPGSVTSIENWAFYDCGSLTSVTFGAGSNITTELTYAFERGNSLWAAYSSGSKAGTYTRSGDTWTQTK